MNNDFKFLLERPDLLERRDVLKLAGLAVAGALAGPVLSPLQLQAQGRAKPAGTARNAILIEMSGGISQMDCWDFKETKSTPKEMDVQKVWSDLFLSHAFFPGLIDSKMIDRCSFVRSMLGREALHLTGQYRVQTGRAFNPAVAKEIPALGSVIAYELDSQRRETDTFPTYVSTNLSRNSTGAIGAGFLANRFSGLDLDTSFVFSVFGISDEKGGEQLERRWQTLRRMTEVAGNNDASLGSHVSPYGTFYDYAYKIMADPRWPKVFQSSEEDKERYGASASYGQLGSGMLLARNLLSANAGVRFVYISDSIGGNGPWDFHAGIYDRTRPDNLYTQCQKWDKAFTALLQDLSRLPGQEPGKSLLDETIIVSTSEFGRTPRVNPGNGRDHYPGLFTSLLAGGGVKGGRIIGKTDDLGSTATETGWKHRERPQLDNLAATFYSALGIDWLKKVENTPSGRSYEYVQSAPIGSNDFIAPDYIEELFV
jgi:hypothetical protein